ncbi:hypothetical protein [Mycobacterium sp.]|uniref:hypothetical protein n=1 Tax=Mycobacterium sp. TaxID=1785 RepID=UPI0025DBCF66|nr:hypothetical protein [Mycobacterium sp.]
MRVGASGAEVTGCAGLVAWPAPVTDVAAGPSDAETEPVREVLAQALSTDATPTPPASLSS